MGASVAVTHDLLPQNEKSFNVSRWEFPTWLARLAWLVLKVTQVNFDQLSMTTKNVCVRAHVRVCACMCVRTHMHDCAHSPIHSKRNWLVSGKSII